MMDVRDTEKMKSAVKAKRFAAQTLVQLSIKCVDKNSRALFLMKETCEQFRALPNDVVQQFFRYLSEKESHPIAPESICLKDRMLLFTLLNGNVEDFNLQTMVDADAPHIKTPLFCNWILEHALKCCPQFKRANLELLEARVGVPSGGLTLEFVLMRMSAKWAHLHTLSLSGRDILDDRILGIIVSCLPRLEMLTMADSTLKPLIRFTEKSVDYLSQMKILKVLGFWVRQYTQLDNPIWHKIAGKVPSLQRLQMPGLSTLFIKGYEQLYPFRPHLVLDCFRLGGRGQSIHLVRWPQNVSVEMLALDGHQSLEVLAMIPKGLRKLCISGNIAPQEVTSIVEMFGCSITTLIINTVWVQNDPKLNILPLLEACPQLEDITIHQKGSIQSNSSNCVLPPQWFSKIRGLTITGNWEDGAVLRKVLLGSQHSCLDPILLLHSPGKMRTVLQVLRQTNSSCKYLGKLEEVQLDIRPADNEPLSFFDDCLEVSYRLIANSPERLKRISLSFEVVKMHHLANRQFEEKVAAFKQFAKDLSIQCFIKFP